MTHWSSKVRSSFGTRYGKARLSKALRKVATGKGPKDAWRNWTLKNWTVARGETAPTAGIQVGLLKAGVPSDTQIRGKVDSVWQRATRINYLAE